MPILTIERVDETFYGSTGVAVRVKRVFIWREITKLLEEWLNSGTLNVRKGQHWGTVCCLFLTSSVSKSIVLSGHLLCFQERFLSDSSHIKSIHVQDWFFIYLRNPHLCRGWKTCSKWRRVLWEAEEYFVLQVAEGCLEELVFIPDCAKQRN